VTERDGTLTDVVVSAALAAPWARLLHLWRQAARFLAPDQMVVALRTALLPLRGAPPTADAPTVAVECVEHPLYFALFAALCDEMRYGGYTRVELVVVRSINAAVGSGPLHAVARSALAGYCVSRHWIRAFRGVADAVAYRSRSLTHPLGDLIDWWRSGSIWRRERDGSSFHELHIDGVQVGDLIIDSYLRFRPRASFQARDRFTRLLLWQACRDLRRSTRYFRRRQPLLYLTTYSTYLEHGIPVRVALQHDVTVRSFGSFTRFGKELSRSDWFHTPDARAYKTEFEALDRQNERLSAADQHLNTRLCGGIDQVMSYMRVSAYRVTSEAVPSVAGATVVFLHDFYDSLHVYPDVVFHDFWSWACFTVDVLRATGLQFFVKPHPNQMLLSSKALTDLRRKYPDLPLIPSSITNAQLAAAGMTRGVTMYGSVAHELAYFGVPSIACARHPHNSFDFCRTARTVAEYERYLRTPCAQPIDKTEMRRQALAFYYMHNLYGASDELALRQCYVELWKSWLANAPPTELRERFLALRRAEEFHRFGAALRNGARQRGR
jgi:hypothetical protein